MTKIEALKKTIYNLENDAYEYNWCDSDTCNCGILARSIMNGTYSSQAGYHESPKRSSDFECYSNAAFCMTTNLPLPRVFQELKDCGFSHTELLELENLSNKKIANNLNWKLLEGFTRSYDVYAGRNSKGNLVTYLKAWVELLQEEQPPVKEIIKYVSVSPEIRVTVPEYSLS